MAYALKHQERRNEHELCVLTGKWRPAAYARQVEVRKEWNKKHRARCALASKNYRARAAALGFTGNQGMYQFSVLNRARRLKKKQEQIAYVLKKRSCRAHKKLQTKAQADDAKMWPRWRTYTEGRGYRRAEVRVALSVRM